MAREKTFPFKQLPTDKPRHANREIGGALNKRQSYRLLGWNPEYGAQEYEAPLLCPECARDDKSGAANCMHETFDDKRLRQTDRVAHKGEHNEHLCNADDPAGHMHH